MSGIGLLRVLWLGNHFQSLQARIDLLPESYRGQYESNVMQYNYLQFRNEEYYWGPTSCGIAKESKARIEFPVIVVRAERGINAKGIEMWGSNVTTIQVDATHVELLFHSQKAFIVSEAIQKILNQIKIKIH